MHILGHPNAVSNMSVESLSLNSEKGVKLKNGGKEQVLAVGAIIFLIKSIVCTRKQNGSKYLPPKYPLKG